MVARKASTGEPEGQSEQIITLPISSIRLDFQPHENLLEETVHELIGCLKRGEELPPVYVRFDGTNYLLQDGFHRVEAMKRLRKRRIKATVRLGTLHNMEGDFREYLRRLQEKLEQEAAGDVRLQEWKKRNL